MHEGAERSKQSNTHALSTDARSVQTYTQGRGKARARGGGGGTPGCPATWAAEYRPYIRQGGTSARRTRWACRSPCTSPPTVIVPCCHPPRAPARASRQRRLQPSLRRPPGASHARRVTASRSRCISSPPTVIVPCCPPTPEPLRARVVSARRQAPTSQCATTSSPLWPHL